MIPLRREPDEEPDDLFADGPTKWEVDQATRRETTRQQRARNDALIAWWRAGHPKANCPDSVALEMAKWERDYPDVYPGRQPERKP